MIIDFGVRSIPPCEDCDHNGHCTMNCGPVRSTKEETQMTEHCPHCASVHVRDHEEQAVIEYSLNDKIEKIRYIAHIHTCDDCKEQWTESDDEQRRSDAIVEFLHIRVLTLINEQKLKEDFVPDYGAAVDHDHMQHEIIRLNNLLRLCGWGQGEIDSAAVVVEELESEIQLRRGQYNSMFQKVVEAGKRMVKMENAIREHLAAQDMKTDSDTVHWWIECNQPADIRTMKGDDDTGGYS